MHASSLGSTNTSSSVTENVTAAPTHTVVTASANPIVLGGSSTPTSITFTATVTSGGGGGGSTQASISAGTVTFTVTDPTGAATVSNPAVSVSNGQAVFTYTPADGLVAGTYVVTAVYNGSTDYGVSDSQPLQEQVVDATALGAGGIATTGTIDASVTLQGNQSVTIALTQGLDGNNNLTETGAGVTYMDANAGINFTSTAITEVVFDPNGRLAEIIGTGTDTSSDPNATPTPVNFVMLVNTGSGSGWSRQSIQMTITGLATPYQHAGAIISGNVSFSNETVGSVSISSLGGSGSQHDQGLQSWLGEGGGGGGGGGPGYGFRGWARGW